VSACGRVIDSPTAASLDRMMLYEMGVSTGPQNGQANIFEERTKIKQHAMQSEI
jgi:hypothetical protein